MNAPKSSNKDVQMLKNRIISGYTLLELMVTLSIAAILLLVALPSFAHIFKSNDMSATLNQVTSLLNNARYTAISNKNIVTLCPSKDFESCSGTWSDGAIMFNDYDGDRQFNNNDQPLRTWQPSSSNISLSFRAFGYKKSLQWLPTGITNHQNGTFVFCYQNAPKYSKALIMTKSGRIRVSQDSDNDGIDELASGDPLPCY